MNALKISPIYVGGAGLVGVGIGVCCVNARRSEKVNLGTNYSTGGVALPVLQATRAHGNFAEWVPINMLMLVLAESVGALPAPALHAVGAALVLGRIAHAYGLIACYSPGPSPNPCRVLGTMATAASTVTLGIALPLHSIKNL